MRQDEWKTIVVLLTVFTLLLLTACTDMDGNKAEVTELNVSAAASLMDVFEELKILFEEQNEGIAIIMNYGSSGALQQQIEQGAPVDAFISAGQKQMDDLQQQNLIFTDSRVNLLKNTVVLISPTHNSAVKDFLSLQDDCVRLIGLGEPTSVPAGGYAQEVLTSYGMWEVLKDKYVLAKDVRQVLTWVETGNVDAGVVYMTEALTADVKIVEEATVGSHTPVIYPAAIMAMTKQEQTAAKFLTFLASPDALNVFERHGFKVMEGG